VTGEPASLGLPSDAAKHHFDARLAGLMRAEIYGAGLEKVLSDHRP